MGFNIDYLYNNLITAYVFYVSFSLISYLDKYERRRSVEGENIEL